LRFSATEAAEKLAMAGALCQGTTSAVPQVRQNECGLQPLRNASWEFGPKRGLFRSLYSSFDLVGRGAGAAHRVLRDRGPIFGKHITPLARRDV
jgi:hypothetical protein